MTHWATEYAERIIENTSEGVLVIDVELTVLHANRQAALMLGFPSESALLGMRLDVNPAEGVIAFLPDFRGEGGGLRANGRYLISFEDNRDVSIDVSFVRDGGEMLRHIALLKRVDATSQIDKQVFQSEKLAAMDNIVAGVAHELNNPMTAILGYAELLLATETNEKRKKRIALIAEEADRCGKIIANMLSFTRSFGNEYESANIETLLEEVVALRSYQMKVDGVEIDLDLSRDVPMTNVQPSAMRRLFLNLLHNSHQALLEVPAGQRNFWVKSRLSGNKIFIEMMDSGSGIPEEIRYKIFDPFFSSRPLGEGMGLGLSVAYGIVHEHRGTIWMEPRKDGGTIMRIELPVVGPGSP